MIHQLMDPPPVPLALIAACNEEDVIGYQQRIPWYSPKDFRFFRAMTEHSICWMGKKTLLSLPKLLPHRAHIVFTRNPDQIWESEWVARQRNDLKGIVLDDFLFVVTHLEEAVSVTQKIIFEHSDLDPNPIYCIGGAELFRQVLPWSHWIVLTRIKTGSISGDVFFPKFMEDKKWSELIKHCDYDERTKLPLEFCLYYNKENSSLASSQPILKKFQKALGFEVLA